ncbi:hypothetical protein ECOK1357_1423 [Escherichia coli OK1357]|nr:hypothetical protein ECOK1357_1423 [Escherichia coli OK1357]
MYLPRIKFKMMVLDEQKYNEILKTMEKRASRSKITTLLFLYILLTAVLCIPATYIFYKAESNKRDNALASLRLSSQQIESAFEKFTIMQQLTDKLAQASENLNASKNSNPIIKKNESGINSTYLNTKSTFEKAIETAAPYLLILSGILFTGYILRLFIVFIKYNMQMSNDYDNQRIAFLLSQGDTDEFGKIIQTLREHNVSFEKTPNLLQEKIIIELMSLLRSSKNKS